MSLALIACSALPAIHTPDPSAAAEIIRLCTQHPFLARPYRLLHSIETVVGGQTGTVLGISLIDPQTRTIHSAILTLEGFVLFEARYEKKTDVIRAVPSFTSAAFADSMMQDIRLVFLPPEGSLLKAGRLDDESAICRYSGDRSATRDIIVGPDGSWQIIVYDDNLQPIRKVRAGALRNGIPGILELSGFSTMDYSLKMTLLDAEPVSADALRQSAVPGGKP